MFSQLRDQWSVSDIDDHFTVEDSDDILDDIEFTVEDIENACSDLKNSASAGPDGVPACLLATCKKQLAKPLHTIWRASLGTGVRGDLIIKKRENFGHFQKYRIFKTF